MDVPEDGRRQPIDSDLQKFWFRQNKANNRDLRAFSPDLGEYCQGIYLCVREVDSHLISRCTPSLWYDFPNDSNKRKNHRDAVSFLFLFGGLLAIHAYLLIKVRTLVMLQISLFIIFLAEMGCFRCKRKL